MSEVNWDEFEGWLKQVDEIFIHHFGLGRDDFPDHNYAELFEECFSPQEAFEDWAEENGYDDLGFF